MLDLTFKDLGFLKAMQISTGEPDPEESVSSTCDPDLATEEQVQFLIDAIQRSVARSRRQRRAMNERLVRRMTGYL